MQAAATIQEDAAMGRRRTGTSEFDVALMPRDKIFKRSLVSWSVHHSLTTSNWIATLSRPQDSQHKQKYLQFPFPTEREARKFCKSYAPPKFTLTSSKCLLCDVTKKDSHCRNCGAGVCGNCSTRWGSRMVPRTYLSGPGTLTVRVCKSCDWL